MTRINPVVPQDATIETRKLLDGVQRKLGMLPNMFSAMARSPALVRAYLGFSQSMAGGVISPRLREQIALVVAQVNGCDYCLAAHTAMADALGLSEHQIIGARSAMSDDPATETALRFARSVADNRGDVSDAELLEMHDSGFSEEEITEIIGHVALNTLTNFFNRAARTEIDFPAVPNAAIGG